MPIRSCRLLPAQRASGFSGHVNSERGWLWIPRGRVVVLQARTGLGTTIRTVVPTPRPLTI